MLSLRADIPRILFMKKHSLFIILFSFAILFFLWQVIFMRAGFVYGDYSDQFYPWSFLYSNALKNFTLPYWIKFIQSGFPLMAEGQIGGFYPFNILMYFLMP
ncbi:hypothetical protein OMAG_002173, partial [Candidatus Omnitrophus magneticus]